MINDPAAKLVLNLRVMENGCHEWQRCRLPKGYGRTRYLGRNILTHRLAWIVAHGDIPDGMDVCHHCDNPPCCNPAHLFLGTAKTNVADMIAKGRRVQGDMTKQRVRKLTHEQVDVILNGTERAVDLARRFGVSEANVSMIRSRKRKVAPRGACV